MRLVVARSRIRGVAAERGGAFHTSERHSSATVVRICVLGGAVVSPLQDVQFVREHA